MPPEINHLGQPIGTGLPQWVPPLRPSRSVLAGRFCRLEPLDSNRHAAELFSAFTFDGDQRLWTYLPYGPFDSADSFRDWMDGASQASDPLFFAIVDPLTNRPDGVCSYLRIDPGNGSIEAGHLIYSPRLQRTPAATEALFLLLSQAFELGYRRFEWKCDSWNGPSRSAALRFGFQFEGLFRQAVVYKQRNRDTAWYSILDREWPALRTAFQTWLSPGNFDGQGQQRSRLSDLTAKIRTSQHDVVPGVATCEAQRK